MTIEAARVEHDLLGDIEVPADALWGAHTQRALDNFPATGRAMPIPLIRAAALVKKAAAVVNRSLGALAPDAADALILVCDEMAGGALNHAIVVDPLCGGAGTSFNMNVNEVLANRANQRLGRPLGGYDPVHPLDGVNRHQSTNDVFPTAVRVAALWELGALETALVELQQALQVREQIFADDVTIARTQLMDALPITVGQMFATWAEAIARDRWRVFKSVERLKIVNMGGTAVGTGVAAPRAFIFRVIEALREETGLPLSRAENPVEATSNQDAVVEVHGILTAAASNLLKLSTDLRLLASSPVGEFALPPRQAGSSIMPGKVNPVIPEYAAQIALEVIGGHTTLTTAIATGNLQLSQFFPLAAWRLLDSLRLLRQATQSLARRCVAGIEIQRDRMRRHAADSPALGAALVPVIGYATVQRAVLLASERGIGLRDAFIASGVDAAVVDSALAPSALRRLGDPNDRGD